MASRAVSDSIPPKPNTRKPPSRNWLKAMELDDFVLRFSRLVCAVLSQIAALGPFMPLRRHDVPSLRHDHKSPAFHKPRPTFFYSTACSIRRNTKWRPSHRAHKLLVVAWPLAYCLCGKKRRLDFLSSPCHTRRNVFRALFTFAGAGRACGCVLVLLGLSKTKSEVFHYVLV